MMGLATTALRISTGALMAAHGLDKLTSAFGGKGLDGAAQGFESMGIKPARQAATLAAVTETTGGVMMAAGIATPIACSMITGVMATAVAKVHYKNGFFSKSGGYEMNMLVAAAAFAIAGDGGGALTMDGLFGKKRKGFGWAVAQLAMGVGAAAAAMRLGDKMQELDAEKTRFAAPSSNGQSFSSETIETDTEPSGAR